MSKHIEQPVCLDTVLEQNSCSEIINIKKLLEVLFYYFEGIVLNNFLSDNSTIDYKTIGVKYRQVHKNETLIPYTKCNHQLKTKKCNNSRVYQKAYCLKHLDLYKEDDNTIDKAIILKQFDLIKVDKPDESEIVLKLLKVFESVISENNRLFIERLEKKFPRNKYSYKAVDKMIMKEEKTNEIINSLYSVPKIIQPRNDNTMCCAIKKNGMQCNVSIPKKYQGKERYCFKHKDDSTRIGNIYENPEILGRKEISRSASIMCSDPLKVEENMIVMKIYGFDERYNVMFV